MTTELRNLLDQFIYKVTEARQIKEEIKSITDKIAEQLTEDKTFVIGQHVVTASRKHRPYNPPPGWRPWEVNLLDAEVL